MTKADIINEIAKQTGLEKVTIARIIQAFMGCIKDSLGKNKNVYLRGFGSFTVKKRAKKTARNISKGTSIVIPAHNVPSFKPAKVLLTKVAKIKK